MNKKLKKFLQDAFNFTLWESIYYLLGFVVTILLSFCASKAILSILNILKPFKIMIIVIVVCSSIWVFTIIIRKYYKHRPTFPHLDFDFRILECEITYQYLDRIKMTYKKKRVLKALKNGLNTYPSKYKWTGKGNVEIKSVFKDQKFRSVGEKNLWNLYEIKLPRNLKKGEIIDTELIWQLEDTEGKAVPFFSACIEEPTDLLILNISLPQELCISEAICEASIGYGAKEPYSTETIRLDGSGRARWIIKKPKLLHLYEMRWIF